MHTFREGKKSNRGGGVTFIFRSSLSASKLPIRRQFKTFESLGIVLKMGKMRYNIVSVYHKPHTPSHFPADFAEETDSLLDELCAMPGCPIVLGDMNCGGKTSNTCDTRLTDIYAPYGMIQCVDKPTRMSPSLGGGESLLDLIFHPSVCPSFGRVYVTDPGISDHCLVSFTLSGKLPPSPVHTFTTRNFKRLDRAAFVDRIQNCSFICNPSNDVDIFAEQMTTDITRSLDELAPVVKGTKRLGMHQSSSLPEEASRAKRYRRTCEKRYNRDRTEANRSAFRHACRVANALIRRSALK